MTNDPSGIYVVREALMNIMIWRGHATDPQDALRQAPKRRYPRTTYRVLRAVSNPDKGDYYFQEPRPC